MGTFVDKVHMKDAISASLTRTRTEPVQPCPDCGAETRPHGEAPRETSTDRICSVCRTVQAAMPEVPRVGPGDDRPRFPCGKCGPGRETKVHKAGKTGPNTKRICVRPTCKKIIETAS